MKSICIFIASGFGSGFSPVAPGTWGTLVGSLILGGLSFMGLIDSGWALVILTGLVSIVGFISIKNLPDGWMHDDQRIVIDEVVGLFTAMIFIPISWKTLMLSFIFFRIFDIWKPLGIRRFDKLKTDISVIIDDLLAGVYANLTLRLVILLLSAYDLQ